MKTLLVPVDFSDVTDAILRQAAILAQALNATVRLIHVAAPDPYFVGYEAGPQEVRDRRAEELRDEHRKLERLAASLKARDVEAVPLLIQGPTVETILKQAADTHADLIILGSHGRGALYRALVGSVSEGVLRKAPCPVLIVPAQQS